MRAGFLGAVLVALAGCSDRTGGDSVDAGGAGGTAGTSGFGGAAGTTGIAGSVGSDAGTDASGVDGGVCPSDTGYDTQAVALPGCDGIGPGTEDCHVRLIRKKDVCCAEKPCDRLIVYWAGGNQTCDTGDMDALVQKYADRGFVAACAQPYTTEDEGGKYPYFMEFNRMHHLMQELRSLATGTWTGDKLAIGGTSHGGTAPLVVVASAKAFQTEPSVWTGKTHTALLLYDGISNPKTLEEWTGAQASGSGCGLFHQRFVGRYGDGMPLLHSCANGACYCSNPTHAADWAKDTVVIGATDPPSPYQCSDFAAPGLLVRFASCSGSPGAEPCGLLGDIIPDEQQQLPYDALTQCSGITTNYAKYPECSHLLCGGFDSSVNCGGDEGVQWLESGGW